MAGLDPKAPAYVVARGHRATEEHRDRVAAERAAEIIRAEPPPPLPPLPDTMAGRLAAQLRVMYGDRRPPATIKRIAAELRKRDIEFSPRTLDSALALAWPPKA
ncbi:MAG: hypothetical protein P4M09_21200 [Devosia sp.]|nr:hypothetical protein [Devosia sp.]